MEGGGRGDAVDGGGRGSQDRGLQRGGRGGSVREEVLGKQRSLLGSCQNGGVS